ncbi:DUF6183 family protein [Actinoplanes sp. NPDC051513]|uniref:DUF6183 family protein n=1 Tax=Actinoplanes sp. NPDC051513 TaxID=3363908 RepID=UPI00379C73D7
MNDDPVRIAASLDQLDDVREVWDLAEAKMAAGQESFVADLGIAVWGRYGSAPVRPWQSRSVYERLLRLLALTAGAQYITQAVRMVTATDDATLRRQAASLLSAGQSSWGLAALFSDGDADEELCACLVQELVLRGVEVQKIPAIGWWLRSPQRQQYSSDWLPRSLTALEGRPQLPRYRLDGTSFSGPTTAASGTAVPAAVGGTRVPTWRETTTSATAAAIGSAVANWVDRSNGSCEARTFELADVLAEDSLADLLALLDLECMAGASAIPQIRQCTPAHAWQLLFVAASEGGAYSVGEGGAQGRLAAWRSVGALTDSPADAPANEVEQRANDHSWYTVDTTTTWFAQVAWDIALVAMAPDRRHVAVLAATDTD